MEKNMPQDFVAGIEYAGKLTLAECEELPYSAKLLSAVLPLKSRIQIYSKAVFAVTISDSAFDELKANHLTGLSSNPKKGEVVCLAENGKIKTSLTLGKSKDIVTLDEDTKQYLFDKMNIFFSIEKGLKLNDLPIRKIAINQTEKFRDVRKDSRIGR